jgi:hypothetical protein
VWKPLVITAALALGGMGIVYALVALAYLASRAMPW